MSEIDYWAIQDGLERTYGPAARAIWREEKRRWGRERLTTLLLVLAVIAGLVLLFWMVPPS